jgi:methylenetetrahydrofolate--tRNA-(uracil-5-)-methyltransferase
VLRPTWQVKGRDDLLFAGQVSGVEGYVESAASGLLAGINAARVATGAGALVAPRETAIGALAHYVSHAEAGAYQPANITFGILPPLDHRQRGARQRKLALAARALSELDGWMRRNGLGQPGARDGDAR